MVEFFIWYDAVLIVCRNVAKRDSFLFKDMHDFPWEKEAHVINDTPLKIFEAHSRVKI